MDRHLIWIDEGLGKKIKLFCFLKGISIREFATKTLQKALEPYENWLQNLQKLNLDENDKNHAKNIE